MELNLIEVIAVYALPVIFAITLHEAAHAYAAKHFGDLTAYSQGRVSLNPLRHIDPIGTIGLPLLMAGLSKLFGGNFVFGWAKPVPVNFANLRSPKRDMLWVAAAGPAANFVMALFWMLMVKLGSISVSETYAIPLALMGAAGVHVNAIFVVLNLLPIPPLDGGRIVVSMLPHRQAYQFSKIEPYGFIIILALIFSGVLQYVLLPLMVVTINIVAFPTGVAPVVVHELIRVLLS